MDLVLHKKLLALQMENASLREEIEKIKEGVKYGDGPNPFAGEKKLPKADTEEGRRAQASQYGTRRYHALDAARAERVRRNRRWAQSAATGGKPSWKEIKNTYGDNVDAGFGKQKSSRDANLRDFM